MRVVHIITRMIVGGAQENTLLTVQGLRERHGIDARLLTGPETGSEGSLLTGAEARGVPVEVVPGLVRAVAPVRDAAALGDLWRRLARLRPDVVHTHSSKAGILGRLAARLAGVPRVVHTLHGSPEFRDEPAVARAAYRFSEWLMAWLTDDMVGVCRAMIAQARGMGLRPRRGWAVVYSGFDVEAFGGAGAAEGGAARRRLGIPSDAFVIATVARLAPLKGHADVLDAAAGLGEVKPWLLFVGDGPLRAELAAAARARGLEGRVAWAGLVPPAEVPALLRAADCVVHASAREGLARVIPQALLSRRPVVAYALDGAPEVVVPGETGWCVRPGDREGLARAIRAIAADTAGAAVLAEEGARRIRARFRVETMVDALAELYRGEARATSGPRIFY